MGRRIRAAVLRGSAKAEEGGEPQGAALMVRSGGDLSEEGVDPSRGGAAATGSGEEELDLAGSDEEGCMQMNMLLLLQGGATIKRVAGVIGPIISFKRMFWITNKMQMGC